MRRGCLLASALLLATFLGCGKGGDLPSPGPVPPSPIPSPGPKPEPTPAPGYVPSPEMQEIVKAVVPIKEPELAVFYGDFADVVKRDSEIIRTTGDLVLAHSKAGQLCFQSTGLKGKYPTLANDVNTAIAKALGEDDVSMTPERRQRTVDVFLALEWAAK